MIDQMWHTSRPSRGPRTRAEHMRAVTTGVATTASCVRSGGRGGSLSVILYLAARPAAHERSTTRTHERDMTRRVRNAARYCHAWRSLSTRFLLSVCAACLPRALCSWRVLAALTTPPDRIPHRPRCRALAWGSAPSRAQPRRAARRYGSHCQTRDHRGGAPHASVFHARASHSDAPHRFASHGG